MQECGTTGELSKALRNVSAEQAEILAAATLHLGDI